MALACVAVLAVAAVPPTATAGGPFERTIGVGAGGHWIGLHLEPSGSRSENALTGPRVGAPRLRYVRLYSLVGGLPGIPGRYYPAAGVLCLSWTEPPSDCQRLIPAGRRLLRPLGRLPRLAGQPTRLVRVVPGTGVLRTLNVHLGIELALERPSVAGVRPKDANALRLTLVWHGPQADRRPRRVLLDQRGVWAAGRLHPTPPGVWPYIVANAPPASTGVSRNPGQPPRRRLQLVRPPYAGVRCPGPNTLACDRIGIAAWLVHEPVQLRVTIAGHPVAMHPPPPGSLPGAYWQGSLQPAGMLRRGPLHVVPDRGRYHWEGRHPRALWVRLTATYAHAPPASIRLRIWLRPGWG